MLGAVRASWRMFREVFQPMLNGKDCRWALLVGTDLSNGILAHQIQSHFRTAVPRAGFAGHRRRRRRDARRPDSRSSAALEDIGEIAAAYDVTDVLVVAGTLPGPRLRKLMEACEQRAA